MIAPADPRSLTLDPGSYRISEQLPAPSRAGRWRQGAVTCNAVQQRTRRARRGAAPTEVTVSSDAGQACLFRNTFIPAGGIAIAKQTRGAGATTGFVIDRVGEPARQWTKTAITSGPGDVALARGDSTRRLRLGTYVIQETEPVTDERGRWTLLSINCGGRLRGFDQGRVTVQLTRERPRVLCRFVNASRPTCRRCRCQGLRPVRRRRTRPPTSS